MSRFGVLAVLLGGCMPSVGAGWFDALSPAEHESEGVLPNSAMRDNGMALLGGPLAEGVFIESSDPDILRALTGNEINGEPDSTLDSDATVFADFETGISMVALASGQPGFAILTLVDERTGDEISRIEIEVQEASRVALVSAGPWRELRTLVPRILADTHYHLEPIAYGEDGRTLLGADGLFGNESCTLPPSAPGIHTLPCGEIQVVAPQDIVEIEMREIRDGTLVAIGVDRDGEPVLGLSAQWSGALDPNARGDTYIFEHDEQSLAPVEITAQFGDLVASEWIYQSGPGKVGQSDTYSCSTTGPAAGLLPILVAPLLLCTRRHRSR